MKRYNNILEHLEDRDILPEGIFPSVDEDSDAGQLGAEAKLLAEYLADFASDEEEPARGPGKERKGEGKKQDLGMMVALAPFLEKNDLTHMVLKHFTGQMSGSEETELSSSQSPDSEDHRGARPARRFCHAGADGARLPGAATPRRSQDAGGPRPPHEIGRVQPV